MNNKLDAELCSKYPKLFVNRYADMKETCMCWGFECDDGWYNILNMLCADIQHHIDWSVKNNESDIAHNKMVANMKTGNFEDFEVMSMGYKSDYREKLRVEYLTKELREIRAPIHQVTVDQVKEKFGTLRFYYTGGDDTIDGMVRMAESMSSVTCETCGNPGKQRGGGWIRTLCDTHAEAANIYTTAEEDKEF